MSSERTSQKTFKCAVCRFAKLRPNFELKMHSRYGMAYPKSQKTTKTWGQGEKNCLLSIAHRFKFLYRSCFRRFNMGTLRYTALTKTLKRRKLQVFVFQLFLGFLRVYQT